MPSLAAYPNPNYNNSQGIVSLCKEQASVVRRVDSAIHWITQ